MSTTQTRPDRSRPRWLLPAVLGGGLVLAVVLALTQPWLLWVDEVADEQLPTVTSTPQDEDAADDPEPASPEATTSEEDAPDPTPSPTSTPTPSPTATASPEPTGPAELARGSFISRDHATSGEVAIVRLGDGTRVLTIEGLQTDNGPDLYVYLDDTPADGPEDEFDDGIDLGPLRGNVGDLVYEIPDGVDLDAVTSVGIWCDRFSSLFGAADLAPVA